VARLVAPGPGTPGEDWSFEVPLLPEESASVFAMSRARILWRALRWTGMTRRMRQFREHPVVSGDLSIADLAPV
jgi:hypothetical protein